MNRNILRFVLLLLSSFLIISCDKFGAKKTKNMIELTPKLTYNGSMPHLSIEQGHAIDYAKILDVKNNQIKLSKHRIISAPCIKNSIVYIVNVKGEVIAFDIQTNKQLWITNLFNKTSEYYVAGGIVYQNDKLYITNGSRSLFVLDAGSGHQILTKTFPDIIRIEPVWINDHVLLIQTVLNQLFAYDINTQQILWQHEGLIETLASTEHVAPILLANHIIASYSSGQIIILDPLTGNEQLSLNLSRNGEIGIPNYEAISLSCQPIADGKNIYIASSTNKLFKLDITNGQFVWSIDAYDVQSMNLIDGNIFITNNAKQVGAINSLNGKIEWLAEASAADDKKKKTITSFAPFVTKNSNDQLLLTILTKEGEIYSYSYDNQNKNLSIVPMISKIKEKVDFVHIKGAKPYYLVLNNKLVLVE